MILVHDLITDDRAKHIFEKLPRTKRIIDVGCGIRPCPLPCDEHICIDPHPEYLIHLRYWKPDDRTVTRIDGDASYIEGMPRKDTTVLLLDVIEHMEKEAGLKIRDLAEEFEHAIIFTPLGFYKQDDTSPDAWGLNGGHWQKHRSGWMPEDFPNWKVTTWNLWHREHKCGAILAIR